MLEEKKKIFRLPIQNLNSNSFCLFAQYVVKIGLIIIANHYCEFTASFFTEAQV